MIDSKARAWMARLLRGEVHPADISGLLLYARDRNDGRQSIWDIGSFIAHHDKRDKGLVARSGYEWFVAAKSYSAMFSPAGQIATDLANLPPIALEYFQINAAKIDNQTYKNGTGLKRSEAVKLVKECMVGFIKKPDENYRISTFLSRKHTSVIQCVLSTIVVKPAFTGEQISKDFLEIMKSHSIITKEEFRKTDRISELLQLFVIAVMHNNIIVSKHGNAKLTAVRSGNSLAVTFVAPIDPIELRRVNLFFNIFSTKLDPELHCSPELLSIENWNCEIELNGDGKLAILI